MKKIAVVLGIVLIGLGTVHAEVRGFVKVDSSVIGLYQVYDEQGKAYQHGTAFGVPLELSFELIFNRIGFEVYIAEKGYRTEYSDFQAGMTKLWGQFALQAGAGISVHPVKNFFLDPYFAINLEVNKFYIQLDNPRTGVGARAHGGLNLFIGKHFFFNADVGILASIYPLPISFWSEGAGIWSGGNLLVEPVVCKLGLGVGF